MYYWLLQFSSRTKTMEVWLIFAVKTFSSGSQNRLFCRIYKPKWFISEIWVAKYLEEYRVDICRVCQKNLIGKKPHEKSIWTKIETSRHKFLLIIIYCWNRVILSWAEIRPSLYKVSNWNIEVINPAVKFLKVKFWIDLIGLWIPRSRWVDRN